jgi:hypothetical protein
MAVAHDPFTHRQMLRKDEMSHAKENLLVVEQGTTAGFRPATQPHGAEPYCKVSRTTQILAAIDAMVATG